VYDRVNLLRFYVRRTTFKWRQLWIAQSDVVRAQTVMPSNFGLAVCRGNERCAIPTHGVVRGGHDQSLLIFGYTFLSVYVLMSAKILRILKGLSCLFTAVFYLAQYTH